MVYYPLSMLMLAGIREILVISTPEALPGFQALLKDGSQWGMYFAYAEQAVPRGLADAFFVGREFIGEDTIYLILGDNIFFGRGILEKLARLQPSSRRRDFCLPGSRPGALRRHRVRLSRRAMSIEEKPEKPRSNFAVPGIYFYDYHVVRNCGKSHTFRAKQLEITDISKIIWNEAN